MDHFKNIYTHHADLYHRLIAAEDVDGNLLPALEKISSFSEKFILDLGTGTGRIPLLLQNKSSQIFGLDLHDGMLYEQQKQNTLCKLVHGDLKYLPFPPNYFDIVTAGWAIGHFTGWFRNDWKNQVDTAIREMSRVTKSSGALIIIETLTTGSTTPAPPTQGLAEYYNHLENHWGFNRQEIFTQYQFASIQEAVELTKFFFGQELAQKNLDNNWDKLPEWTGVWGRKTGD